MGPGESYSSWLFHQLSGMVRGVSARALRAKCVRWRCNVMSGLEEALLKIDLPSVREGDAMHSSPRRPS